MHQPNRLVLELWCVGLHHSRHVSPSKSDDTHSAKGDVLQGQAQLAGSGYVFGTLLEMSLVHTEESHEHDPKQHKPA